MSQTITDVLNRLIPIINIVHRLPITTNKGRPGLFLEELLGIPHTSNCLDCSDGEVKTFPVKKLRNGVFVPKESVAVTMLSITDIVANDYNSSKCCIKMSKVLFVPYYREGDTIQFIQPKIVERGCNEFSELYTIIENDYTEIRNLYLEKNILQSKTGTLLQNRTKGAGHGSTSRAFYLRPEFMKRYIPLNL